MTKAKTPQGCKKWSLFTALILTVSCSIAFAGKSDAEPHEDALAAIGGMLTQSVLLTRVDANVEKTEIIHNLEKVSDRLGEFLAQSIDTPLEPYEDDPRMIDDLGNMLGRIELAGVFLEKGDLRKAHHTCKDVRLKLAELRSRNGVVNLGDMAWRYNCAFHPMMHEVMHKPANAEIGREQIKTFHRVVENAEIALSALEAAASHRRYENQPKLRSLIKNCKTSLTALSETLEKSRIEKLRPQVMQVRKCFIDLAGWE